MARTTYRGTHRAARRPPRHRRLSTAASVVVLVVGISAIDAGPSVSRPATQHVAFSAEIGALRAHARPWKSGVFAGYTPTADAAFGNWRGAPVQTATVFTPAVTWDQLDRPTQIINDWGGQRSVHLVLSTAMWPSTGGDLAAAAAGRYDHHFATLARNLVAGGLGAASIRLGWEFNGTWYRWSVRNSHQAAEYAEAWRQVVAAMRSVTGAHFGFVWCVTIPNAGGVDPALSYPGDRYVTDIAADVYDRNPHTAVTPIERWDGLVFASYGLTWQAAFAAAHDKPIAFPEWGLVGNSVHPAAGGGDDPGFVLRMYRWFASHDTDFEDYFNTNTNTGTDYQISAPDGPFPAAAAVYRALYAAGAA